MRHGNEKITSVYLLILVFTVAGALAQKGAKFGLRIGVSQTSYHGSDLDTILSRVNESNETINGKIAWRNSQMAGIYVNNDLAKHFWLKHEFYWTNKGAVVNYEDGSFLERNRMYLDLYPVLFSFRAEGFQLFAGPYIGVMFLKKDVFTDQAGVKEIDKDLLYDISEDNFLDFGGVSGIEYQFNFGLNLGLRYFMGFAKDDTDYFVNLHNQGFFATVGFTFGAGDYR